MNIVPSQYLSLNMSTSQLCSQLNSMLQIYKPSSQYYTQFHDDTFQQMQLMQKWKILAWYFEGDYSCIQYLAQLNNDP